jgi:hypothetical protein
VSAAEPDEQLTPAQRAAAAHLGLLRDEPLEPGRSLAVQVMRTTRWQRAIRAPLRIAALIAASVLDGLGLISRRRSREPGR